VQDAGHLGPAKRAGGDGAAAFDGIQGERSARNDARVRLMDRISGQRAPAGVRHVPVLLPEVLGGLAAERGGTFLDGTFGAGGYSRGILGANRTNRVLGIDRDPDAIAAGAKLEPGASAN
jgi:hypothetical protein